MYFIYVWLVLLFLECLLSEAHSAPGHASKMHICRTFKVQLLALSFLMNFPDSI